MTTFRFLPPAGTPMGFSDVVWWARHVLTDGDTLIRFEEEIRTHFGVRYCAFVSTGRAALTLALLALKALDGARRDEVVIPSYTCYSVASSVVKAGLKIRLADVDPTTLDYAPGALETLDGSRVLAIVATNLYGLPNDLPAITRLAKARGVFVVDDAAQCLGGSLDGRSSGTWGDVGIYSLDKGKNITSIDGGILVTNSERVAEAIDDQVRALPKCAHGQSLVHIAKLLIYAAMLHPRRYWLPNMLPFLGLGTTACRTDYPLAQYDSWMAPMGRRFFARLDAINATRIQNADRLRRDLPWGPHLEPVVCSPRAVPACLRFPVLIRPQYRDAVVAALCAKGIGATASYPTAISDVPELQDHLRSGEREAMRGREVALRIVTLPTHGYVTPQDHETMVKVVTAVLGPSWVNHATQSSVIETQFLSGIDSIGLDAEKWNALTSRSETNTVFQTHQWARSWLKAFGDQYEQMFISVADPSGVVGVAPLVVRRGLAGERVVRFLGDGKADYCDFLAAGDKPKVLEGIFGALFASRERWDVIELNNIPAESSTIELVQAICHRTGYRSLVQDHFRCHRLLISGHEDEALKIFNKAGLRRRQHYFERIGHLAFKDLTGTGVIPYLEGFFDQHIARWTGSKSPSLFLKERNRIFYQELAAAMADKGWLLLSVVELNDQPMAMHYGFDYNGTLMWYKPSFDVAYAKHSPGLVLLRHLIGYAIDHKCREFDLTIGDEPFKRRFSNRTRKTVSLKIFRNPGRFFLEYCMRKLLTVVKRLS